MTVGRIMIPSRIEAARMLLPFTAPSLRKCSRMKGTMTTIPKKP